MSNPFEANDTKEKEINMQETLGIVKKDLKLEDLNVDSFKRYMGAGANSKNANEIAANTYGTAILFLSREDAKYPTNGGDYKKVLLEKEEKQAIVSEYIKKFFTHYEKALADTIIKDTSDYHQLEMRQIFSFVHNMGNTIGTLLRCDKELNLSKEAEIIERYDLVLERFIPVIEQLDILTKRNGFHYNESVTMRVKMSGIKSLIEKYCREYKE